MTSAGRPLMKQQRGKEMRLGRWQGPQIVGALKGRRATGRWRQEVEPLGAAARRMEKRRGAGVIDW